ncbi:MAG: hypothetical protein KAX36_08465, partial [Thermoflexales bacterium]|nr:hypothetical protein [Thermoflexales bacterium]
MKYLLTSAGINNDSLRTALVELLGKPIAEASALCIPTAILPFPGGPSMAYRFINGITANRLCGLGWKSLGVLELTALPSIKEEYWIAAVQEADALLVAGGSGNMTGTVATDRMFLASLIELGRQASE